jgi:L-asparaginase
MKIHVFAVGGTIDKVYFDAKSDFQVGEPQIGELLHESNVTFDYVVESLMRKDSIDMTDDDRRLVREAVDACEDERILITHGTDTMADTARYLHGVTGKTVVFTGAMQPARFRVSDAIFNIGFAIGALQQLPNGIYVAMNGQVFDPAHLHENVKAHRFEIEDD